MANKQSILDLKNALKEDKERAERANAARLNGFDSMSEKEIKEIMKSVRDNLSALNLESSLPETEPSSHGARETVITRITSAIHKLYSIQAELFEIQKRTLDLTEFAENILLEPHEIKCDKGIMAGCQLRPEPTSITETIFNDLKAMIFNDKSNLDIARLINSRLTVLFSELNAIEEDGCISDIPDMPED